MLYATATVLLPGIVPYTLVFMNPTNQALSRRAEAGSKKDSPSTAQSPASEDAVVGGLLKKWKALNYGRASMVLTATLLGMVATVLSS